MSVHNMTPLGILMNLNNVLIPECMFLLLVYLVMFFTAVSSAEQNIIYLPLPANPEA